MPDADPAREGAPAPLPEFRPTLKPPLKWAGGKRWLVPEMVRLWADYTARVGITPRLVEPFCGGLAVALGVGPGRALLNDINPHLINFYRWLQRGLTVTSPMRNESALFYAHRDRFNALIRAGEAETAEAAQLFYYLNRTGFNGLCRFNRSGEFNVPFGLYKTIHYEADFAPYQARLADWEFCHGRFDRIDVSPSDFIYADPPYDVEFTQYSKEGFGWADQVALATWLSAQPCPVVLSNQATARIVTLYASLGFEIVYLDSPRRISANGDRTPAREVLATKRLDG
jgi:DNA adenine methylase